MNFMNKNIFKNLSTLFSFCYEKPREIPIFAFKLNVESSTKNFFFPPSIAIF